MNRGTTTLCSLILCCIFSFQGIKAQEANSSFGDIDERLLIESRWKYTYTLHVESNTVVHQADENYQYYLYFRYNYSYEEFLNGDLKRAWWSLENRTLDYSSRNIEQFEVANLNKKILILEFNQPNSTGTFQYHFVRVTAKETPFVKPPNELPDVLVEDFLPKKERKVKKEKRGLFAWFKKKPDKYEIQKNWTYINIELVGGGYYGGIDPVLRDIIHIKNDGRLIKEFQTKHQGLITNKKNIPRDELEQFAEYIVKQNFFSYERIYDCESRQCYKRKATDPRPVPLRLAVTYGDRSKIVTVGIWGKDKYGLKYINYPPELDKIIDAIQRMANRLEEPVVRK